MQQPRVFKPSQRFNTHRSSGQSKNCDQNCSQSLARGLNQQLRHMFWTLSHNYESHETSVSSLKDTTTLTRKLQLKLCATKHPEKWTEERVLRSLCPHPLSAALVDWLPTTSVTAGGFGLFLPARLAVGSISNSVCHAHTLPRLARQACRAAKQKFVAATSHQQCWCALPALQILFSPLKYLVIKPAG